MSLIIKQVKTCSDNRVSPRVSIIAETSEETEIKLDDLYYIKFKDKNYYFIVYAVEVSETSSGIIQKISLKEYGYYWKVSKNPEITSLLLLKMKTLIKENKSETIKEIKSTAGYI